MTKVIRADELARGRTICSRVGAKIRSLLFADFVLLSALVGRAPPAAILRHAHCKTI